MDHGTRNISTAGLSCWSLTHSLVHSQAEQKLGMVLVGQKLNDLNTAKIDAKWVDWEHQLQQFRIGGSQPECGEKQNLGMEQIGLKLEI